MSVAATPAPLGFGLKSRPNSWPTLGSFRAISYLKIVFPKFLTLATPPPPPPLNSIFSIMSCMSINYCSSGFYRITLFCILYKLTSAKSRLKYD